MKKSAIVMFSAVLAISSLSIGPLTGNAEFDNQPVQKVVEKSDLIMDNEMPSNEIAVVPVISQIDSDTMLYDWTLPTSKDGEMSTNVVVNDGASFTWDYVNTVYSSDVVTSQVTPWLAKIVSGGLTAVVTKRVPTTFFKGVSTTLGGTLTFNIKPTAVNYYKVVKYLDTDAYNVYLKYDVYQYSDKARTKLVKRYTQVHKG